MYACMYACMYICMCLSFHAYMGPLTGKSLVRATYGTWFFLKATQHWLFTFFNTNDDNTSENATEN